MVHDTENFTFSADDRADNPHIAVRPSAYIRADRSADSARTLRGFRMDNHRIPCGTISGFRAKFCECKTKITQGIDIQTIFATCFSIFQPVVVHEVCLLVFRHFPPKSALKIRARPHGKSASFRTTIRRCPKGTTTEFLGKS